MSREYLRQAIDAEVESLAESALALKLRRNALVPVLSLPSKVIVAILSFLRSPGVQTPLTRGERTDFLAGWHLAHVCHQWREVALNQPLFWNHVNFTILSSVGAAEILARANTEPLYLEARVPGGHWDDAQSSAFQNFQNQLHAHLGHICQLSISAERSHLHGILTGLVSPAPILEYLLLSNGEYQDRETRSILFAPETLFDGTAPRLSSLELRNCYIRWTSPLLKGLRHLDIRTRYLGSRPKLAAWLDALDEMAQLKTLILHAASPAAPSGGSLPFDVERTTTLPSLTDLDISVPVRDCALALAHLVLPALTRLSLATRSCLYDASDVQEILPYIAPHAHGPQDAQPLQSVVISGEDSRADFLAWTVPDIDSDLRDPFAFPDAIRPARVALSVTSKEWFVPDTHMRVFDAAMAALPLDSLVTLTAQNRTCVNEKVWLQHAPRWPLLQCVRLVPPATDGFKEMLLDDNGEWECPLLPSLTKLVLMRAAFIEPRAWALGLCDALMKRVEQGVPLEVLDLRTCAVTDHMVQLFSEIVLDVRGPTEKPRETRGSTSFTAHDSGARGPLVQHNSHPGSDADEDDPNTGSGDEEGDEPEMSFEEYIDHQMTGHYYDLIDENYWPSV